MKKGVNRFPKNSWQFSVDSFSEKHFISREFTEKNPEKQSFSGFLNAFHSFV